MQIYRTLEPRAAVGVVSPDAHRRPGTSKMLKLTTASGIVVGTAVLGITVAAFFASDAPTAKAEPPIASLHHQPLAEADRLPARAERAACSYGWPYYEQGCRFDLRTPAKEARPIRIIALR
jgi:hypothetical protein